MQGLINYIQSRSAVPQEQLAILNEYLIREKVAPNTILLAPGKTERYIYFLAKGIVKGYKNIDGKIVIQHLVEENDFFTSLESFMHATPSDDYYETITPCELIKINKSDFEKLREITNFWSPLVEMITNEHLNCKLERVKDFQVLTAKERYLKFIKQSPNLALNVSVDNIASFLGMEPQSLSRIRKQITF